MRKEIRFALALIFAALLSPAASAAPPDGLPAEAALGSPAAPASYEDLYRRFPQLLELEQKLDRASAHFYFGERALCEAAAGDLAASVAALRAQSPDSALCERLAYLDRRARALLDRMAEDERAAGSRPYMVALIDSCARHNVVEEEIEIEYNAKTQHWIDYFQGSGRKHFSKWLERTGELRDVIEPILVDVGIPRDLLYLAVIESGLNLSARSYANAIGPWQFMSGTARLFGLRINWWLDERKDIVAATYAAANYLRYLYDMFNSWPLALAAYNTGEHRVAYQITHQRTTDYWQLHLPTQTTWFVPKFMAALAIGRNPEQYGFRKPESRPLEFDIIEVDCPTQLSTIANAAGCTVTDIKALNPHFKKWSTPPDMVVEVKVPKGAGGQCREGLTGPGAGPAGSVGQHKVKKGETLSGIAQEYGVSVKDLRALNEMKPSASIRAGAVILVPVKEGGRPRALASRPAYRTTQPPADAVSLPVLSAPDGGGTMRYVVRRNDTLVKIAERFHTSLADLREWNNLAPSSSLRPGDTLLIGRYGTGKRPARDRSEAAGGEREVSGADERGSSALSGESFEIHVVKRGETLASICRRYQVTMPDVLAWNDKTSGNKLYPGEKLKIRRRSG